MSEFGEILKKIKSKKPKIKQTKNSVGFLSGTSSFQKNFEENTKRKSIENKIKDLNSFVESLAIDKIEVKMSLSEKGVLTLKEFKDN